MLGRAFDDAPLSILVPKSGAAVAGRENIWEAIEWADLDKGVSGVKSGESLDQVFLGSGGGHRRQKAGERAQYPGYARPSGPGATLRRRSLAPRRLQPGCELGLRRTLLAARGRYSLCLSASTAAAGQPALFRFPLFPNTASQAPTSHREGFRFSCCTVT